MGKERDQKAWQDQCGHVDKPLRMNRQLPGGGGVYSTA